MIAIFPLRTFNSRRRAIANAQQHLLLLLSSEVLLDSGAIFTESGRRERDRLRKLIRKLRSLLQRIQTRNRNGELEVDGKCKQAADELQGKVADLVEIEQASRASVVTHLSQVRGLLSIATSIEMVQARVRQERLVRLQKLFVSMMDGHCSTRESIGQHDVEISRIEKLLEDLRQLEEQTSVPRLPLLEVLKISLPGTSDVHQQIQQLEVAVLDVEDARRVGDSLKLRQSWQRALQIKVALCRASESEILRACREIAAWTFQMDLNPAFKERWRETLMTVASASNERDFLQRWETLKEVMSAWVEESYWRRLRSVASQLSFVYKEVGTICFEPKVGTLAWSSVEKLAKVARKKPMPRGLADAGYRQQLNAIQKVRVNFTDSG